MKRSTLVALEMWSLVVPVARRESLACEVALAAAMVGWVSMAAGMAGVANMVEVARVVGAGVGREEPVAKRAAAAVGMHMAVLRGSIRR